MESFVNTSNAFNYIYERTLAPGETVIVKMPPVSANKRGINDIGWMADDDVKLYATLQNYPEAEDAIWQEILVDDEINKTTRAVKAVNIGNATGYIIIRALLN